MGTLTYDVVKQVHFDDRLLAHLQLVIATKLRRGESFNFSWKTDASEGSGRTTIWLHPAIPLLYEFQGSRQPAINRLWLDDLMTSADTVTGLQVIPEPRADRVRPRLEEAVSASAF
ncbi:MULTISPECIES: DUF7882 family protein [unclassified Leifsonia]|uniref:DUF7882 family protein n=1 Tax=unclassified Leifsonia TaxID=2663824 RepID=UPI0006F5A09E|nr:MULTISPECIES: hypothetical protein [unclassified Leifsonia]KQX06664.1 ATP-dependent DNA ligase [Leifsonia sp. Root1293]KRA10948.1 ATP-dependent DNA ligase [Leifsonia sp. Root60]